MASFRSSSPRNGNSAQDGKKKRKPKGFSEQIGEIRSAAIEEALARRRAEAAAARREDEDEVARMTFGPSYKSGE